MPGAPSLPAGVSQAEARQPGKSPHFSVNWVVGTADVEVIDATTGKRSCGRSSRLCKHRLSARWARLYGKVSGAGHGWGPGSGRLGRARVTRDTQTRPRVPARPPPTPGVAPPSGAPDPQQGLMLWPQK